MIHLIKLCVGVARIDELVAWRAERRALGLGRPDGLNYHRTRTMPKRRDELIEGGSLYWVMSGLVRCRQRIVGFEEAADPDGKPCCHILMQPEIIRTLPFPKRPFQGWRYLRPEDAPGDLASDLSTDDEELAEELVKLGLL